MRSGKEQSIEVKPSYGLTDNQVEAMITESFERAEEDFAARQVPARPRWKPTPSCSRSTRPRRATPGISWVSPKRSVRPSLRRANNVLTVYHTGTHLQIRDAIEKARQRLPQACREHDEHRRAGGAEGLQDRVVVGCARVVLSLIAPHAASRPHQRRLAVGARLPQRGELPQARYAGCRPERRRRSSALDDASRSSSIRINPMDTRFPGRRIILNRLG